MSLLPSGCPIRESGGESIVLSDPAATFDVSITISFDLSITDQSLDSLRKPELLWVKILKNIKILEAYENLL